MLILPSELKPGELFSWQVRAERELNAALERNSTKALQQIKEQALSYSLTPASARTIWAKAVDRTLDDLGLEGVRGLDIELLREDLLAADLGEQAYTSATWVMTLRGQAGAMGPSPTWSELSAALDEVLDLESPSLATALTAAGGWVTRLLGKAQRVGHVWRTRLNRQARTGFTGLTGRLVIAQMRQQGDTHKKWVTRHDDKVRTSHAEADGQVRELDMPFTVGGESLQYPGQRTAPMKETASCRCIAVPADRPS